MSRDGKGRFTSKSIEHNISRAFEIRIDQGSSGYKAITRRPKTLEEAEDFISRNGGTYGTPASLPGVMTWQEPTFDIVEVEVIHREKIVRKVKRKFIPAKYELVDA